MQVPTLVPTKVIKLKKQSAQSHSIPHHRSGSRKARKLLDSYNASICKAFSEVLHMDHGPRTNLDVLPDALEAVNLIMADFVERLLKEFCTTQGLNGHAAVKAALKGLTQNCIIYDACLCDAEVYATATKLV
eukprot:Protomagalhaensia_sp_Gyna_25__2483@NODE_2391_length_1109_cov_342_546729_g1981_i0_p1_GENE_NODE_2391_length_1109_cov_342_546729_g1981_i0NODE_2391_length_1109_cov_342_546729_g1981_i0_p1_ORF_typecomplete_len132_score10_93Vps53_N/PF04100_12/0_00013_NODE_2391_length_1109_cov_342_546729_g1981_i0451846